MPNYPVTETKTKTQIIGRALSTLWHALSLPLFPPHLFSWLQKVRRLSDHSHASSLPGFAWHWGLPQYSSPILLTAARPKCAQCTHEHIQCTETVSNHRNLWLISMIGHISQWITCITNLITASFQSKMRLKVDFKLMRCSELVSL